VVANRRAAVASPINRAAAAARLLTLEGMLAMPRLSQILICVVMAAGLSSMGCRSCSTCHDYDPPVANCGCNGCGCNRAGSAYCGCASGEQPAQDYVEEGYAVGPAPNGAEDVSTQTADDASAPY
jgi:hypothetical protein